MKKYLVLALACLLLALLLAGCAVQINNPIGGIMDGISRSLAGIGDSITRMFDNVAKGIKFGP